MRFPAGRKFESDYGAASGPLLNGDLQRNAKTYRVKTNPIGGL